MAIRRWTWLLMPLLLAGCNGTPLGDQLSSSFSPGSGGTASSPAGGPAASAPATGTAPSGSTAAAPTAAGPDRSSGQALPPGSAPSTTPPTATATPTTPAATPAPARTTPATPPRVAAPQPSTPAPYRVTIKLPAADPSAPAEAVTRALRSAGLTFEVETIERVPAPGGNRAGTTPAPATR